MTMFPMTRREMLARTGTGFGMLGLVGLLGDAGLLTGSTTGGGVSHNPLAPKPPHFPAKAKHVIHIYLNGGPSQVDTFDPKPMLAKYDGKPLPAGNLLSTERKTGAALASPFKFKKYGQSGADISEIFAKTAEHNLELLARLGELRELGWPLLVGPSRKSFIGAVTGAPVEDRVPGTLAAVTVAVLAGAELVRVHDVAAARQAARVAAAIRDAAPPR